MAKLRTYVVGEAVRIEWRARWFTGRITSAEDGRYGITYEQYDASWDEVVGAERLRRLRRRKAGFAAGDRVHIEWKTEWFRGKILELEGMTAKVHYAGWDAAWDEWVDITRLLPRKKKTLTN